MKLFVSTLHLSALLGTAALCLGGCAGGYAAQEADLASPRDYADPEDPFNSGEDDGDGASDDDDDSTDGTEDPAPPEAPAVVALDPAPDTSTHHYRTPIVVTFDRPSVGATVGLYDAAGYSLPVTQRWNAEGTQLRAEPAQWLLPGAEYTVSVDVGEASLEYTFATSDIGSPLQSGANVDGNTFAIDFSTAESTDTPALAALMGTLGTEAVWLWQVNLDSDSQAFGVTAGLGGFDDDSDGLYQDLCTATEVLATSESPVELADPYFASSPAAMVIALDGVALEFESAWFDGDFAPDGAAMVEMGFYGWLKADSVEPMSGPGEACGWLGDLLDLACEPCPSGVGECAHIAVDGMEASEATVGVDEVADADADDCGDQPIPLLSCSASGRSGGSLLALAGVLLGLRFRRR